MQKKIILILLFALVIAFFAIQNASPVSVKIFNWEDDISLAFIVLGAIVFGALIMYLVSSFKQLRLGKKIRTLKKEKEKLNTEKDKLTAEIEELEGTIGKLRLELNKDKSGTDSGIEELEGDSIEEDNQDEDEEMVGQD